MAKQSTIVLYNGSDANAALLTNLVSGEVAIGTDGHSIWTKTNGASASTKIADATTTASVSTKAPLSSPALTGTPTAPTAAPGTNTTQIATTAFVADAVSSAGGGTISTGSVVSTNGFAGSVTPSSGNLAITVSTTVTGMVKGNGTALSAATSNSDYLPPASPAITGTATFAGSSSGTTGLRATAVAGSTTLTLPAATDTLVGKATADVFTNKTIDTADAGNVLKVAGTSLTAVTGTGNLVLSASPTLTGTLTAGTISATGAISGSNLTGTNTGDQTITLTGNVTGSGTGSFATTIAAGVVTNSMLAGSIAASKLVGSDIVVAESQVTNLTSDLATKAPLASPTFTGTPAAPTASTSDNSTTLATTGFVQTLVQSRLNGQDWKQECKVLSSTNVTLAGGAPSVVDGITLLANDRVLVIGQSTTSQNGIYTVTTVGTGANGTWARASDEAASAVVDVGTAVMVTQGTVYKGTQWAIAFDGTNPTVTVGTTAQTWGQIAGPGSVTGTSPVSVVGTTISLAANGITAALFRQSAALAVVGNATGSTANVTDIAGTANQFLAVNSAGSALAFTSTLNGGTF